MKLLRRALVASLVMALLAAGMTVQPAAAEVDAGIDSVAEVEEAVEEVLDSTPVDELVEETAADVSDLVIDKDASDVVVELEADNGASVEIPAETDEAIVIENTEGDELEIELPGNGDDAEVTDDGSVVYEDALPDTDIVVQAQDGGGVRVMAVIDGPDAPRGLSFPMETSDDSTLVLTEEGGAALVTSDWELTSVIPAPWAYDASGNEVPAWYTVEGDRLILNVAHSDAYDYPIVADPCWSCLLAAFGVATLSYATVVAVCAATALLACASAAYAAGAITLATYQTVKSRSAKPLLCEIKWLTLGLYPSGKVVTLLKTVVWGGTQYRKWKVCN